MNYQYLSDDSSRQKLCRPKATLIWVDFILNIVKKETVNKTLKNLEKIEVFDTDLKSEGTFRVLFFGTGNIIARSKRNGKYHLQKIG